MSGYVIHDETYRQSLVFEGIVVFTNVYIILKYSV